MNRNKKKEKDKQITPSKTIKKKYHIGQVNQTSEKLFTLEVCVMYASMCQWAGTKKNARVLKRVKVLLFILRLSSFLSL